MISYYAAICFCSVSITMFFDSLFDLHYYKREVNRAGYYWMLIFSFVHAAASLALIKYIFTH
jgi:hypothetical protein